MGILTSALHSCSKDKIQTYLGRESCWSFYDIIVYKGIYRAGFFGVTILIFVSLDKQHLLLCITFFLLTVAAHVGVVAVQRSCSGMGTAAVILGIECVDSDVD